jgi:hypothetical protein
LQKRKLCVNDFPDHCEGCPEYREKHPDSTLSLVWVTGTGMVYPGEYKNVVVKECKLYHKRKAEFLK